MLRCIKINYVDLPTLLLCAAKGQCRVEFDRDDDFLKSAIARAIGEVEAVTNLCVFNSLWEVDGVTCPKIPKTPVRQVMVDDGTGTGTWVRTSDILLGDPFYFGQSFFKEPYAPLYRVEAGYVDLDCLPPALVNAILLITANIYENRESQQMGMVYELPDTTRRLLTGLWQPSV